MRNFFNYNLCTSLCKKWEILCIWTLRKRDKSLDSK